MNYRAWQLKNADTAGESALLAAGYGPLLARVLACRGIAQPQAAAALLEEEPPLSDPFLLKDMDKAVARIQQAIENGETIVIFGDYDVDGVSATAILYECLTNLGAQVRCKLPTREGGGYGLNRETLQKLADKGYKLIVTVDNGISAIEEADLAAELGIELVITDHHLPAQQLPKAVAVVDPKREDDTSPFKDLCGAGVAFKLCAALEGCEDPAELLEPFGELAALGTIADVMPLVGENRTIVKEGLATLQDTLRPGLQALLENAGYAGRPVTAETVSYGLAPRLNAAGRMDTAAVALKLLLCENEEQAAGIAARLSEINTSRQQAEQQIALLREHAVQHMAFELQCHRRDLVVHRVAELGQAQHRAAAVIVVEFAFEPSRFHHPRHRATDGDLVHRGALRDLVGGQAREAAQHRHHPPFGHAQREPLRVFAGNRTADPVGQHAEPVRQEMFEIQLRMRLPAGPGFAGS